MRKPIIAGNWKMNGSRDSIKTLLDGIKAGMGDVKAAEVAVCAPYIYLPDVADQLKGTAVAWGGQNLSTEEKGAFTGEISASMLLDFSCKYVIVGHSERRTLYGEDDALVAKKFAVAHKAGLTPILCIGETLEEREKGITEEVCARQLKAVIDEVGIKTLGEGVIAYEPVWAIGTGKTASPEQAQDVHAFIRGMLAEHDQGVADGLRIQYGGSMNAGNAKELLAMADIDGGLIGGASLKAEDFLAICTAAD
ncbi:MAG: triose-phosphate isomerase [Gammaproteobacteria bacterium]|nr:triose-phosphate isomerase [Gammaproteobacteria bacterium]MDH5652216.1 triose-phosphate isomerase [Gammaproteobacteria bacterium]